MRRKPLTLGCPMRQSSGYMEPLITTVIPTYRRPQLLRRAIRSVLAQTYPNFRACVYDNASFDQTAAVVSELARHDERVQYYCHRENIGAWRNFAFGVSRVKTPFFSILSDDDFLLPNFFADAIEQLTPCLEAGAFAGHSLRCDFQGRLFFTPNLRWKAGLYSPPNGCLGIVTTSPFEWNSMLFRRDVLDAVGGLDADIGEPFDFDFQLRVAARFPLLVSDSVCALLTMHPGSASSQMRVEALKRALLAVADKFENSSSLLEPGDRVHLVALMKAGFRTSLRGGALRAAANGEEIDEAFFDAFYDNPADARNFAVLLRLLRRRDPFSKLCRRLFLVFDRMRFAVKRGSNRLRFARYERIARSALAKPV